MGRREIIKLRRLKIESHFQHFHLGIQRTANDDTNNLLVLFQIQLQCAQVVDKIPLLVSKAHELRVDFFLGGFLGAFGVCHG